MFRRWSLSSLAVGTLLASSGCGGRLFHRRCDTPAPRPRGTDSPAPRGVIQPRDFDPIPPSTLPTTPAPRPFDPVSADPNRTTFSPVRPGPRLLDPPAPHLPPAFVPNSPTDLPEPDDLPAPTESRKADVWRPESKKIVEPTPEPTGPRKLILAPDDVSDSSSKSEYRPKVENGLPVPDRRVLLDPIEPAASSGPLPVPTLPKTDLPTVPQQMPPPGESRSSLKPETPTRPELASAPAELGGPVAVVGFENVVSGRKPLLDGLDWLQKTGYRTVVYLHDPKYDGGPAADLLRRKGMTFVGIPVAPDGVAAAVEKFNATLADKAARPVYVCDDTGRAAGAIWYAHFRTAGGLSADTARVRAADLGLRDPATDADQKTLWDAVQDYLTRR